MGRLVLLVVFAAASFATYSFVSESSTERARTGDQVEYEEVVVAREIARSGFSTGTRIIQESADTDEAIGRINGVDGYGAYLPNGYTQSDFQGGYYRASASEQGANVHLEVTGYFGGSEHTIGGLSIAGSALPPDPTKPPPWKYDCQSYGGANFVEIYGIGLGNSGGLINNPATINIPDSSTVERIVLQVTGRYANINHVIFTSSAGDSVYVDTPAETGDMGMGYFFTELDPASSVTANVSTPGNNGARGFVVYVHRASPTPYVSEGRYKFSTAYHNVHTESFEVPESATPRDIHITWVLSDKDDDGRIVKHYASAGPVYIEQDVGVPNFDNELAITTLVLPEVPGDVTTVDVSIDSNDSIMWTMTHVYSESCAVVG